MIIIIVDFHPEFQEIASVDTDSGEFLEKRLAHREDAETLPPRTEGPEGAGWDGSQRACTLVRTTRGRVAI